MKPTPTPEMIEAAAKKQFELHHLTRWETASGDERSSHLFDAKSVLSAALSVPAAAVVGEPMGYLFEMHYGNGRWSGTMFAEAINIPADDVRNVRPLYAAPSVPEGWQEAARIGDTVLAWMVKFDILDAGNEYRAEDVLAVLNDLAPSDVHPDLEQLRAENVKFRKALAKIAERAEDNLPMYTPGAMVHTAEEAIGGKP